jgi:transposase-like protein
MPNRVRIVTVPDGERAKLERRVRDRGVEARVAERARIVLLAADGLTGPQIAERVGCTEPTVVKWRRQYAEGGLAGLEDAARLSHRVRRGRAGRALCGHLHHLQRRAVRPVE